MYILYQSKNDNVVVINIQTEPFPLVVPTFPVSFTPAFLYLPLHFSLSFASSAPLGIRHFSPSTMSLERKLGTVRSCGEWCRPLGGWVKLVSLLTHLHTNHRLALPCLLLLWVVASGEGRSQSTSSKGYAKKKTVDALY